VCLQEFLIFRRQISPKGAEYIRFNKFTKLVIRFTIQN